jgi:tetratricopeptide (TPR) repeat protein
LIYLSIEKYDEGIKMFDKAIELKDNYTDAYFNKGSALLEMGRFEKAKESFEKCLVHGSGNVVDEAKKLIEKCEEEIKERDK